VAGCGVGPLFVEHRNAAIKHLLELADEVVLRDQASAERARRELGVGRVCAAALDPAFVWIRRQRPAVERDPRQILLALRDWPIEEFAARMERPRAEKLKAQYEAELTRMLRALPRLEPTVHVVPFCMHKYAVGGDDRAFYRRLLADFPEILARLDDRHRAPREDLETIGRSRAILAMRFHSVVFSLGTQTPFLAVDYTLGGKITGLLEDVGATDRLVAIEHFDGLDAARRLLEPAAPVPGLEEKITATESVLEQAFARAWAGPAAQKSA
jgi:polysaccharide pyruvyl transferase WcaK-like protein